MKRFTKWFTTLIVVGFIATIGFLIVQRLNGTEVEAGEQEFAYHVTTQAIATGLDYKFQTTGEVSVGQSARLTAEARANVTEVLVKPGDTVQKGDILVRLYSETVETSYQNTAMMLTNTELSAATTETVSRNSIDIERLRLETAEQQYQNTKLQNQILRTQADETLKSAELNYDLSVASAETNLETAQKSYDKTVAINEANELTAQTALENTIRSTKTDVYNGLNTANELLEVSPDFRGSAGRYDGLIGRRASEELGAAKYSLEAAIKAYQATDESYESMKDVATKTADALDLTLIVLNNTDPSIYLPQATLSGYISSISQSLSMIRGGISGMESANKGLQTTFAANAASLTAAEQQIQAAKNALELARQDTGDRSQTIINAENQHEATLTQIKTSEDTAEKSVETARLAYENALKSSDLSVISSRNAVLSARDAFDRIKVTRDKLSIRAPFAGQIASIPVRLGDEVNAGTLVVSMENQDTLKIVTQVTEQDVERLRVNDDVQIGEATGTIYSIAPSADAMTKRFEVEITAPEELDLKPGQFIELVFSASKPTQDDRIFIPIASVHLASEQTYVWSVEQEKSKKIMVTLGAIQGDQVEVLDGLSAGDRIIIEGGRLIEEEGMAVTEQE